MLLFIIQRSGEGGRTPFNGGWLVPIRGPERECATLPSMSRPLRRKPSSRRGNRYFQIGIDDCVVIGTYTPPRRCRPRQRNPREQEGRPDSHTANPATTHPEADLPGERKDGFTWPIRGLPFSWRPTQPV